MTRSVGSLGDLDSSTLLRIQAACDSINAGVARARRSFVALVLLSVGAGLALYYWLTWNEFPYQMVVFLSLITAFGPPLAFGKRTLARLTRDYKHAVVQQTVTALGHGLTYTADSRFTLQDFLDMDLFRTSADEWWAEDEISGRRNDVPYIILEGRAFDQFPGRDGNERQLVFAGLIVRIEFNKFVQGHTVVVPDAESRILGGVFGEAETRQRKEICRLENVEFEKSFSVYSTDQQEARYVLTPQLMELILEARRSLDADLRLAFRDNSVFVTIAHDPNRFDIDVFGPKATPQAAVGQLAAVVSLAERLIDSLQLETRIWSRV